jgi:hypothetical protein
VSHVALQTSHTCPANGVLETILQEIAVPDAVLDEAKRRRDLVLEISMEHEAARASYASGSVAHGTENKPLEDADGGIKVNRRFEAFRRFGPDAPGGGEGPERFIAMFAEFILPRLRRRGYPNAEVDLTGNRAIKFLFNEHVDIDAWGPVDPYVDFIVGLAMAEQDGLWIPNRCEDGWDTADPERHTWLMTRRDDKPLRVFRAHVLRLAKRAVKRDDLIPGRTKVMCSWNLSALALEIVDDLAPTADGLACFFEAASNHIRHGLTLDPSPVVQEPIGLPEGVSLQLASQRLGEMAGIVRAAQHALSPAGARVELDALYGDEIRAIREREKARIDGGYATRDAGLLATAFGQSTGKRTRSDGAR